ncbi:uncharacterized protein [Procambarus clarkii]|uniref:uncharacterized protein isoform X1 n=1 Tax=Procambarus clarkii TaxID=6728 RepID=UPI00374434EF
MARAIAGRGAARRPPQAKVVRSRGGQCGAGRRGERSARRPPQAKVVRSRGGQCGAGRRGERCCSPPASLMLLISHLDSAVDQVTCARLTDMYESASVQRHCRNGQPDPRKWSRTTALQVDWNFYQLIHTSHLSLTAHNLLLGKPSEKSLRNSDNERDLGVVLNRKLSPEDHIKNIV